MVEPTVPPYCCRPRVLDPNELGTTIAVKVGKPNLISLGPPATRNDTHRQPLDLPSIALCIGSFASVPIHINLAVLFDVEVVVSPVAINIGQENTRDLSFQG
jgi:hypothetical protein